MVERPTLQVNRTEKQIFEEKNFSETLQVLLIVLRPVDLAG